MEFSLRVTLLRLAAIAFYAVGLVVCVMGALRFESNIEDVFQWLPDDTTDREVYDDFVERFGIDDFLVVTWPDCSVKDERMEGFSDSLLQNDSRQLIVRAISGRELIKQLARRNRQSPSEIIRRFDGIYFGQAGLHSCVMVMLSEAGMENRRVTIDYVQRTAEDSISVSPDDLILAGYPQVGAYGDSIVRSSLRDLFGPSCVISTLVAWICLRHLGQTLMILAVGGLAAGLSIAVVTLSGSKWGGLSSVIPTLAYILTVSGSLHLVNYSRTPGPGRVLFRVLRIGWKPCTLSALTTAAGMLSLCRSDFPAIREFGIYCASGVLVSLACQLVLVPIAIDWVKPDRLPRIDENTTSPFLDRILPWSGAVVTLFVGATVIAGYGLTRLRSDLEVERNFSMDSSVMQNILRLEQSIGPVEQTEILVTFRDVTDQGFAQRLEAIRCAEQNLSEVPAVKSVLSLATFLPDEPTGGGLRSTAARAAFRKRIGAARNEPGLSSYLHLDGNTETWRVSLRFPFMESTDFTTLDSKLPEIVERAISESIEKDRFSIEHTGVVLLYYVAQDELIEDLFRNFAFAFLTICPLMMLVLRSVKQGLVAMIPNVCPTAVAYGLLGWFNYPIDIGMAMTACVALGIAVDDTTHFMLRIQDLQGQAGGTTSGLAALRIAFHQCSRAMFHTTVIAGLGLSPFLFGSLMSMTRFAALLTVLIMVALACDLILLPSLLKTTRIATDKNAA